MSIPANRGFSRNNDVVNKSGEPTERQLTLTGKYRKTEKNGTELITFTLRLGYFKLVFIVNLPQILFADDDQIDTGHPKDEAPVYVKFQIDRPRFDDENATDDRDDTDH